MDKYDRKGSQKIKKKLYKCYGKLWKRLSSMKHIENDNWEKTIGKHEIYLTQIWLLHFHFSIKVLVDNDLYFTASIYAWHLSVDHEICIKCFRPIANVSVSQILFEVAWFSIWPGINGINGFNKKWETWTKGF